MPQKIKLLFGLLIVVFLIGIILTEYNKNIKIDEYQNQLRFTIHSEKDTYKTGGKIWVEFELENIGDEPITIFNSFSKNNDYLLLMDLEIVNPDGNKLEYKGIFKDRSFTKEDYTQLFPRQKFNISMEITKCYGDDCTYDFSKAGQYKIIGFFGCDSCSYSYEERDENTGYLTGKRIPINAWNKKLNSTITINLI